MYRRRHNRHRYRNSNNAAGAVNAEPSQPWASAPAGPDNHHRVRYSSQEHEVGGGCYGSNQQCLVEAADQSPHCDQMEYGFNRFQDLEIVEKCAADNICVNKQSSQYGAGSFSNSSPDCERTICSKEALNRPTGDELCHQIHTVSIHETSDRKQPPTQYKPKLEIHYNNAVDTHGKSRHQNSRSRRHRKVHANILQNESMDKAAISHRPTSSSFQEKSHSELKGVDGASEIMSLPDDVLFLIFQYLQPIDLNRLCCVCQRFNDLASRDSVWLQHAVRTAVAAKFPINSQRKTAKEVYRVSKNWIAGAYKECFSAYIQKKLMPWIIKTDEELWCASGNKIQIYKPGRSGYKHMVQDKSRCLYIQGLKDDLTKFVVKDDMVAAGCRNGSVYCWNTSGECLYEFEDVHSCDVHCVDMTERFVISGSRDSTCKVLLLNSKESISPQTFQAWERVWSLKISPSEKVFAAGLAGCFDAPPVLVWDIESGACLAQLGNNHKRGAGVYDMKFESPFDLLTCGYDTFIRLWDLRTNTCVAQWEEPQDTPLYCMETDGGNYMMVGTAHHGMARLWDKRNRTPVKEFYSRLRSPVYSIAIDSNHLFLALDSTLKVLDFSVYN